MRLTKKKKHYDSTDIDTEYKLEEDVNVGEAVDKLGQLEDIEEKLGVDLLTLFKAKKQGIYCLEQPGNKIVYLQPFYVGMDNFGSWHYTKWTSEKLFKDYGKTWALTKEELKK